MKKARLKQAAPPQGVVSSMSKSPTFKGCVLEPLDLLRGKRVFKHRDGLNADLLKSKLEHWAPNCSTFSRAREIPIAAVKNAPHPIRSEEFPTGIPSELNRMSPKGKTRLHDDTQMADLAAFKCMEG